MQNRYKVYCITNRINEYKYIGITSMALKNRLYAHVYEARKFNINSAFKQALRQYGADAFYAEVLEEGLSETEAIQREKHYIQLYRTYIKFKDCKGYNSSPGGEGAHRINDEEKKINQYSTDGKLLNTYESLRGAESITGISRVSIANACDGKAISSGGYQWRRFIDVGYSDIEPAICGIERVAKKVNKYSLDGKYICTYNTATEAGLQNNCEASTIIKVCRGKLRKTGEYQWRYYENTDDIEPLSNVQIKRRRVYQFDSTGNIINTYNSISEASNKTGYSIQSISNSINNGCMAHGYFWRSDSEYTHERSVLQLDLNDNVINKYDSAMQAAKITGINRAGIFNCCNNRAKTAGGYRWRYE